MDLDLKNKSALVCGSTQGIGKASAIELALLGASVTLLARNEDSLKAALKELDASKGQKHNYLAADFSKPEELGGKVREFVSKNGPVHILVNNTGGPKGGPIVDAKPEEFTQTFSNHLVCNHILMQCVLEGMKREKYGRIINIISTSVKQPLKGLGVSNTIRAAVGNWAKTLSNEVAPFGITVNNVLPGMTNTQRLRDLISARAKSSGRSEEEIKKEMLAEIPMGRLAEATEIASAVAFLATPAAAYINGTNVTVDGGRTGNL
jgi:3-oxoacyl-[acyl-carrier protein] reductase